MLELDLYFDRFIKYGKLEALSEVELNAYADLLELEDNKLLLLLQGNLVLENQLIQNLINNIINTTQVKNLN
ncbi:MAG: succinate dehydrogenase assembly factor 2 [Proteobacteria bacterium]|jgi:succinate dehydrogenase flavin-adding protein (antitoxin of CptAB toxin-antitoxin module)|nr:succinate dehydrogenase assembly factor 2 [Pseudomonadota bacterium]